MRPNFKRLTGLNPELTAQGYQTTTKPPVKIREMAISSLIPADQINGIWHFDPERLPEIAAVLGLQRVSGKTEAAA
jgi:hypothetical protein